MTEMGCDVPVFIASGVPFECWIKGGHEDYEWRADHGAIAVGRNPGKPTCWAKVRGKLIGTHFVGLRPAMDAGGEGGFLKGWARRGAGNTKTPPKCKGGANPPLKVTPQGKQPAMCLDCRAESDRIKARDRKRAKVQRIIENNLLTARENQRNTSSVITTEKGDPMKIHDWNPKDGDALQGDVCLFKIPDDLKIDLTDEIIPAGNRLVLAEGEVTGHHHAIWLRNPPAMFRANEGDGGTVDTAEMIAKATKAKTGTAKLYRDTMSMDALVKRGELTTTALAIGILIVEGKPVILSHDEHDAIRIPVGRYYVGCQQEWDAASARRVAD